MVRSSTTQVSQEARTSPQPRARRVSTTSSISSRNVLTESILTLQRGAGNAAVADLLLGRQARPLARVQRDVIIANPVWALSGDTRGQGARRRKISDGAIAALPIWVSNYANLWLNAGTTALAGAPEPEDANARRNWWGALAGNLTWAATSLLAPEMTVAIRVMSFAGAAVGSGALATDAVPSGKGAVGLQLARARDAMIQNAGPVVREVAVDCGRGMVGDIEKQKRQLWHRLIPKVPYESSETMVANMQDRIAAGLKQFSEQWQAWDSGDEGATPQKVAEALQKRRWFEPVGRLETLALIQQLRQRWKSDHPFKPNLNFL